MSKTPDVLPAGAIPLRERLTVEEQWEKFAELTIPKLAPPMQREEMRKAFYAGVGLAFELLLSNFDAEDEATQLDVEYFQARHDEVKAFFAQLANRGRALTLLLAVTLLGACGAIVEPVVLCRGAELGNAADSTGTVALGAVYAAVPCDALHTDTLPAPGTAIVTRWRP